MMKRVGGSTQTVAADIGQLQERIAEIDEINEIVEQLTNDDKR